MLATASQHLRAACRWITHQMVWMVAVVALSASCGSAVHAAGCTDRSDHVSVGMDPFGKPLANDILKIYSGGAFHYFALPHGKSCHGPNCHGTPPTSMTTVPPVIASERCDLTLLPNVRSVGRSHHCDLFSLWPTTRPASPVLAGLLRPPTI